jgi:hypothetical protein
MVLHPGFVKPKEGWRNGKCFMPFHVGIINMGCLSRALEITEKGIKLQTYNLIDSSKFLKAYQECKYNHNLSDMGDSSGHCTRTSPPPFNKWQDGFCDHGCCKECKPENCTPEIIRKVTRNEKQIYAHLLEQQQNVKEACERNIRVTEGKLSSLVDMRDDTEERIAEIPKAKLDYSNPDIEKILKLAK